MFEHFNVPVLGRRPAQRAERDVGGVLGRRVRRDRRARAGRAPPSRLPQLCFLVLAAFLMTNKVWSPQYVVWLVPLAVLARPRLWPYLLWQLAEVAYFFRYLGYLIFVFSSEGNRSPAYGGISTGWYFAVLGARFLAVALLAATWCGHFPVGTRRGACAGADDPRAVSLTGPKDRFRLRLSSRLAAGRCCFSQLTSAAQAAVGIGCLADDGALAARTTSSSSAGSMVPERLLACCPGPSRIISLL